jgi:hypothetical protein
LEPAVGTAAGARLAHATIRRIERKALHVLSLRRAEITHRFIPETERSVRRCGLGPEFDGLAKGYARFRDTSGLTESQSIHW